MNAAGGQTPVLAMQGHMPGELVDQHAGDKADLDATALEDRQRHRDPGEDAGLAALVDRDDVTDHTRGHAFGNQLADHTLADKLVLIGGNIVKTFRFQIHILDRNIGIKAQPAVIDRIATPLLLLPGRLRSCGRLVILRVIIG